MTVTAPINPETLVGRRSLRGGPRGPRASIGCGDLGGGNFRGQEFWEREIMGLILAPGAGLGACLADAVIGEAFADP